MIKYGNNFIEASFALCEGRHNTPVKEAVFPNRVEVISFMKLENYAMDFLEPLVNANLTKLTIYVSGCTPALIALLNASKVLGIKEVVLMHYDQTQGTYQKQDVVM